MNCHVNISAEDSGFYFILADDSTKTLPTWHIIMPLYMHLCFCNIKSVTLPHQSAYGEPEAVHTGEGLPFTKSCFPVVRHSPPFIGVKIRHHVQYDAGHEKRDEDHHPHAGFERGPDPQQAVLHCFLDVLRFLQYYSKWCCKKRSGKVDALCPFRSDGYWTCGKGSPLKHK